MKKSMYSLILSEDVVSAIDRLAYEAGTNRSQMINEILAQYVSYRTPEMRISEMFSTMEELFSPLSSFTAALRGPSSFFSLRSALSYKYNPTIQYSIELYRTMLDDVGELKVGLRTQNSTLKLYLIQFYKLWSKLEQSYQDSGVCALDGERFVKTLRLSAQAAKTGTISEEELCAEIVKYVCVFDDALKAFFYNHQNIPEALSQVESIHAGYKSGHHIIM